MKLQHVILILLFTHSFTAEAQEFKNFTTEEGLPSNEVYGIFQDKNGAMWFSTDRGLCQYNGYEFKKYEPKDGLTDITIFDFFPQENGQVWCNTFNRKLFYFENGSNHFVPYRYNNKIAEYTRKYNRSTLFIKQLAVDKTGKVYISNGSRLFFSISATGKRTEFVNPYIEKKGKKITWTKPPAYINSFRVNTSQEVTFSSDTPTPYVQSFGSSILRNIVNLKPGSKLVITDSIIQILYKKGKPLQIPSGKAQPISGGKLDAGHFWIGYRSNGFKFYDLTGKCTASFLPHATVSNLLKDCYGGLWVSTTDYGVYYLAPNSIQQFSMDNNVVNSLTKDDHQNLFIGTYNGDLYKKEKKGAVTRTRKASVNFPAYVQFYEGNNSMVISNGNWLFFGNQLKNKITQVTKISDDSKTALGMSQFGIYTIWEKNNILTDTLTYRIHDISRVGNAIYFGTIDGLKILENGKIHQKKGPLFNCRIDDIDYSVSKGILYAATLGKGILVYNTAKNMVYAIDKTKGLSNDIVTEVYIENDSTLWACTNYGLNRIRFTSPTTYKADYISTANGLISNQIKDIEIIEDSIYIGTSKGLCAISKKQYGQLLSKKYYFLRLKDIYINNTVFGGAKKKLDLSHSENQIDFMVEGVSFSDRKEIEYHYKLEGLDKNWKNTRERKLSYAYIPPGDYTLWVEVIEDGRSFSKECIVLPIHIDKPFWKTFWFLGIMGFVFAAIIYFFFKIRVLSYNKDMVRELLRLLLKRIKRKDNYFSFKESGKEIRVRTSDILFVRSSGNYIDIVTLLKTYTVRGKIGDFLSLVQDPLEFLRIHRSYIVRIDKVEQKSKKAVYIQQEEIPVGETYVPELDKILF